MSVHGVGFRACTRGGLAPEPRPAAPIEIRATWKGGGEPVLVTADAAGEFDARLTVPSDTVPDDYDVTALCPVNSKLAVVAAFAVTPAPEPAALTLNPAEGAVGTRVAVRGSGFGGCSADGGQAGAVTLAWDGGPLPAVTPAQIPVDAGAFTAGFTVPSGADAGAHTVTASCAGGEQVSVEQPFKVTAEPGPRPAVTLDPASIRAGGGPVDMAGSGFDCAQVALSWDGEKWATVAPAADGTFGARFDVPSDAAADSYTVRAECTDDPAKGAEAAFKVTGADPVPPTPTPTPPTPTPTPPTPTPTPDPDPDPHPDTAPVGVVVGSGLLGAALLALAGFVFLSHGHRGPRWVRDHVGSRLRPAPAATDVTEPSGTGPPTRSVRLEPHPDPGDQTLKEEDP
ncbi:hypothetical protein [Streptomyces vinaceus]|uniref:hypothetical protein n=1 Tax=Streptomyces vinaceus TaxID=1960 RepID=UPI003676E7FF